MVSGSFEITDNNNSNSCETMIHSNINNPKEDVTYWKQLAEEYIQKLQQIREEFDEFQGGSRELEAELETQLEQYEHRVDELHKSNCKLEREVEEYKEKNENLEKQSITQVKKLEEENIQLKVMRDEMKKYIRELEQTNDDLERAKRATICTLEEFDTRLNNLIERNAFLENELEEKELLVVRVQSTKDETDDLKDEKNYEEKRRSESKSNEEDSQSICSGTDGIDQKNNRSSSEIMDSHSDTDTEKSTGLITLLGCKMASIKDDPNPSAKISALNVVSEQQRISALDILTDLLWKVANLESKFSCNNVEQKNSRQKHSRRTTTPLTTPLLDKRSNRKTSSQKMLNDNGKKKTRCINISKLVKLNI